MTESSKKLGQNLRRIRTKKGLTQVELCKKLKVDVPYISNLENGNKNPTLATIEHIAEALGVRAKDLL